MLNRREFLTMAAATAGLMAAQGSITRAAAQQALSQDDILRFEPTGQLTLLHLTDIHAQLTPLYFREPSINLGVGSANGRPPHLTGKDLLNHYGITPGSPEAYMLTSEDFNALAQAYGRVGGMDRIATLVKAIRAERPEQTLLLDGGDTWHGSWSALQTRGEDMVRIMNLLKPDAMSSHWEHTLGEERVLELIEMSDVPFLAANIFDAEWDEPVFESTKFFERGGVNVAVIGQAFPYTPIANPRYMIPNWSFGIREDVIREKVQAARDAGAQVVVLLSHNGFDVDVKVAEQVEGIDIILTGHTHDALPAPLKVGNTLLIGSGSNGKFLTRLDVAVDSNGVTDVRHKLLPIFADVIEPDAEMASLIQEVRAPFIDHLNEELGTADGVLYRRGNFNGTMDDVICDALLEQREAEIALSPGFRWGTSLPVGQPITRDFLYSHTAMTYPAAYRMEMTGETLKTVLEDVGDNLFNTDPYYQQGGDMVRVGGMGYSIDVNAEMGSRFGDMTLLRTGEPIEADKSYVVTGWASVNEGTEGPDIWDVVADYIKDKGEITVTPNDSVKIR